MRPAASSNNTRRSSHPFLWLLLLPAFVLPFLLASHKCGTSIKSLATISPSLEQEHDHHQQQQQYMTLSAYSALRRKHAKGIRAPLATPPAAPTTAVAERPEQQQALPVVIDVVYCINMPEDTSFFRIDYGEIEALFRQTVRHLVPSSFSAAGTAVDDTIVRFHLLSNDDEAIRRMKAVHPALRVHDYRESKPSERSMAFLQRYVHQSVNPMEMERLCMWRWIVLADFITQLQHESGDDNTPPRFILGIDTDVGLFQPPSRLLSEWKLEHWVNGGFECHQIALGAAMLWSPKGLESFAQFVGGVYTSPEQARRRVKEWGGTFPFCRPGNSLLLPCDENATKPEMWHLSDMDVLRAWLLQNKTIRTRKSEEHCLVVRQAKRASGTRLFLRSDNKHTDGAPPTLMGIRPVDSSVNRSSSGDSSDYTVAVTSAQEPEELCMLHFQGPNSKQLIKPFDAFLEGGSGNVKKEQGGREEFVLP